MLALAACSAGDTGPDAGQDGDGQDGDGGSQDGDSQDGDGGAQDGDGGVLDGEGDRPDHDPEQGFLVVVHEGMALCSSFCEARTWEQEVAMASVVELAPGYQVLPRQEGFHETDFVRQVRFGADRLALEPAGPGEFEAVYHPWPWGAETWDYTFRQGFLLEGEAFGLEVALSFYSEDGQWPAEPIPGTDYDLMGSARIGPGEDWITEQQAFNACDSPASAEISATTEGGDSLGMDKRYCHACQCAGNTSCYLIAAASVRIGGHQAEVTDHFSLIYSAGHHNEGEVLLIRLDPPADDVHALLVASPPLGSPQGGSVAYLDGDLSTIRTEDVIQWEVSHQP
jgi:hypothetical protein